MRTKEHEIDTIARRKVLLSFPSNWEHRELTGRDYGVDLFVEIFDDSLPKGNLIPIQLKGTEKEPTNIKHIDFPVNTLKYSEIFQSPVILMICPIKNNPQNHIYYLWLQEYINIILDYDKPNWRENKRTVRLHIPSENIVQQNIDKIEYIAEYPQRIKGFVQIARICSDLEYLLDDFQVRDSFNRECYIDENGYLENLKEINSLLTKIESHLREIVNIKVIMKLSPDTLNQMNTSLHYIEKLKTESDFNKRMKYKIYVNRGYIISPLMTILGLYNDPKYRRTLWEIEKSHLF